MKQAIALLALAGLIGHSSVALAKGYGTEPTPEARAASANSKPKLVIYTGSDANGQYFQRAILADERVKNLRQQYHIHRGTFTEAASRGYKNLPTILVTGHGGTIYKHEGGFRYVEDLIAFVMAVEAGAPPKHLQGGRLVR